MYECCLGMGECFLGVGVVMGVGGAALFGQQVTNKGQPFKEKISRRPENFKSFDGLGVVVVANSSL